MYLPYITTKPMGYIFYGGINMIRYNYKFHVLSCMMELYLYYIIIVLYYNGPLKECIPWLPRLQTLAQDKETSIN